ncbi:MAG: hypothetical protein Ct9H300mP31_06540 [Acidimicrobiaceae bacterium]|nr:MAG: hypothetical protein Ct9H300mP31_06540 [Acidimicrobiaceae bacterium]
MAFLELDARFPGGRGTFLDPLDTAADREVDVRVLFWHPEGILGWGRRHVPRG